MSKLTRVVLRLARNPDAGYPEGDDQRGYVIVAPLQGDGHLDLETWRAHKAHCTVVRFSPDEEERADGWLSHHGARWFFRYDEDEEGPDEPVYRLGDHKLAIGEYVTVHEHGGDPLVYRVTEARAVNV